MPPNKPIGSGHYRNCYAIDHTNLCTKVLRPLRFSIISLLSHSILNPNQEEMRNYEKIPPSLKAFFVDIMLLDEDQLISSRPRDFDGSFSQSLSTIRHTDNAGFWSHIDFISDEIMKNEYRLFDVFHGGQNIVVQKISPTDWVPIIIDCKRLGWKFYPLQPNLLLTSEKKKKFLRRLRAFTEKYNRSPL